MSGVSQDGRGGLFNSGLTFSTAAGLAIVPGVTRVTALGHNPSIGSGAAADIWAAGGEYPFLAAASILEVVSSSVADTAAGTGARTVLVSGLDASYNAISETVTLNGTTPVATVNSYLRVNLFTTTSAGSGEKNVGTITLRVVSAGVSQSIIQAGIGFGTTGVYTVAAGFTLFITSQVYTVLNPPGATAFSAVFGIQQRSNTGNKRIPLRFQITSTIPYRHDSPEGIVIAQRTDLTLRVVTTGQAGTDVTGALIGFLIDNTKIVV